MTFPLSYSEDSIDEGLRLCATYGFVHSDTELPRLHLNSERLELLSHDFNPIFIDFTDLSVIKRAQQNKNQGLIKACKPYKGLKIVDATAGFGRDAFILAYSGAEVTMLERSPILVALLENGLSRLEKVSNLEINLKLIYTESLEYISNLQPKAYPDIIYLDPMHPTRKKKALVKKEMQVLQDILGFDADLRRLLDVSINKCKQSVVLKWPQRERPLLQPHHSISGKTVRFDVYKTKCNSFSG